MSEFQPVTTAADLDLLDSDDIVSGYRSGLRGASEPGSDKSRSYWHGWRNGMVDSGRMEMDPAMWQLVAEHIRLQRAH
jgi:ribosome modulation factor